MRQLSLLCLLLSLLTFTAAFPWPAESPFEGLEGDLARRLEERAGSDSSQSTTSSSPSSSSSSPSSSNSSPSSSSASKNSKSASGSDSKSTDKASKTTSGSAKTTEYDPRLPPGGISMITPAATTTEYYKIGNWVTFAWNYTSLSAPPKQVDVLATCSANQAMYTLALNQSFHQTQTVLWDTGAYQSSATVPLLTETYTLIIYDAASSISATAKAGYLAVYDQWTFGMYIPQSPTPLSNFQCATCSGAMSSMERQTLAFLLGMGGITVLTFTIFANNFGLF